MRESNHPMKQASNLFGEVIQTNKQTKERKNSQPVWRGDTEAILAPASAVFDISLSSLALRTVVVVLTLWCSTILWCISYHYQHHCGNGMSIDLFFFFIFSFQDYLAPSSTPAKVFSQVLPPAGGPGRCSLRGSGS